MIPFSHFVSGITASGLRQSMGRNAHATILDEAEPGDIRERGKIKQILDMARLASTKGAYKSLRGTNTGKVLEYDTNHIFCLGSIQRAQLSPADNSRFFHLPLTADKNSQAQFDDANAAITKATTMATALLARAVKNIPIFLKSSHKANHFFSNNKNMRAKDQLAPLVAGYFCLDNDMVIEDKNIADIIDTMGIMEKLETNKGDNDVGQCFSDILSLPLPHSTSRGETVGQAITEIAEAIRENNDKLKKNQNKALETLGMRVDRDESYSKNKIVTTLFISNRNKNLDMALDKIGSYVDYRELLKQHTRYLGSCVRWVNLQTVRGKSMDISDCIKDGGFDIP